MENLDIRILVMDSGIRYKEVAEQMGVTAAYLSRVLKVSLTPQMRARILAAINVLKENRNDIRRGSAAF